MQDSKTSKRDATNSDATSKETLDDLEESGQVSDSENREGDEPASPDGALDAPDEIKHTGPV